MKSIFPQKARAQNNRVKKEENGFNTFLSHETSPGKLAPAIDARGRERDSISKIAIGDLTRPRFHKEQRVCCTEPNVAAPRHSSHSSHGRNATLPRSHYRAT